MWFVHCAATARNPYLHAALRSLPFSMSTDAEAAAVDLTQPLPQFQPNAGSSSSSSSSTASPAGPGTASSVSPGSAAVVAAADNGSGSEGVGVDQLQQDHNLQLARDLQGQYRSMMEGTVRTTCMAFGAGLEGCWKPLCVLLFVLFPGCRYSVLWLYCFALYGSVLYCRSPSCLTHITLQLPCCTAAFPTTLEQDEVQLSILQSDPQSDPRDIAAVLYRTERKKVLRAVGTILDVYLRT